MAPKQKPGRSKQDYRTPPEFLVALKKRLSIDEFVYDLAASDDNTIAKLYFTEENSALGNVSWNFLGGVRWAFCNPPYADIEPWVKKATDESNNGAHIAMLVPASVGSNWWANWVDGEAHVLFLNGRLSFDGIAPYPKDCALLLYTPFIKGGYEVWKWTQS